MRAIKYKYALALNLSIVENEEFMIKEAIEQAKNRRNRFVNISFRKS